MSAKNFAKAKLESIFTSQTNRIVGKHQPKIIAVTGSVGKTSTKLAIATVLQEKFRIQYQSGNYNTEIAVPFIFLGRSLPNLHNPFGWFAAWLHGQKILKKGLDFDVVIVELGTDSPGDIIKFRKFLHPNIAVITAVSEEHMEYFGSLDIVAKEELSVAEYSDSVLASSDDIDERYLQEHIPRGKPLHSYGFEHAEYKITAEKYKAGFNYKVFLGAGQVVSSSTDFIAKHSLRALAAAVAIADLLGVEPELIEKGLKNVRPTPGRMQVLSGIKNSLIIDDTYNASPLAYKASIAALYETHALHKIAILGTMNELGNTSEPAHREIGQICDPKQISLILTIGKDANNFLADAAEKSGCKVLRCKSPYEAGKLALENLKEGSVILAKGSQNGVFAEEALKPLLANQDDVANLVRQSDFWLKKKRSQFTDAT